jgi:hypothetical protein
MDQDPGPMIFNLPNVELAKYTSKNRIRPMINSCEAVRKKKTDNRHDFTTLEMNFDDMVLSLVGAGSDIQAMSRPCRYLFRDEVDEIDASTLKMIYETTTSFANRKVVDTSTTTVEEGNVWQGLVTSQYVSKCGYRARSAEACRSYFSIRSSSVRIMTRKRSTQRPITSVFTARQKSAIPKSSTCSPVGNGGPGRLITPPTI